MKWIEIFLLLFLCHNIVLRETLEPNMNLCAETILTIQTHRPKVEGIKRDYTVLDL